ncbi:MAG: hypothetical protein ACRDA5_12480, partial [Clostridium sp.]
IKEDMKIYLDEKYGKEFVVEKLEKHSSEAESGAGYLAESYAVDDETLRFKVKFDERNDEMYQDSYILKLGSREGQGKLDIYLKELYGEKVNFEYNMTGLMGYENYNVSIEDFINKEKRSGVIKINYYVFTDSDLDKEKEAEKIFEVYEKFLLNKIEINDLIVRFYNKDEEKKYTLDEYMYGLMEEEDLKKVLINEVRVSNFKNVTKKEDIMKCFEY